MHDNYYSIKFFKENDDNFEADPLEPQDYFGGRLLKDVEFEIRFSECLESINISKLLLKDGISHPNQCFQKEILKLANYAKQWINEFDFHFVKFNCALEASSSVIIDEINIRLNLNQNKVHNPPIFLALYPKSKIKKSRQSFDIDVSIPSILDIAALFDPTGTLRFSGKTLSSYKYSYSPKVYTIKSGGANTTEIFWNITRDDKSTLAGDMETGFIVKRPRSQSQLQVRFDVSANALEKYIKIFTKNNSKNWNGTLDINYLPSKLSNR